MKIFLHGFAHTPQSFNSVLAELKKLGNNSLVYCPCLPGHGMPASPNFQAACTSLWQDCHRHAQAQTANTALTPIHLIGYSMGARLALGMALQQPQNVARLTLIGVNPGLPTQKQRQQRQQEDLVWQTLLTTAGLEVFFETWQKQPLFASQKSLPASVRAQAMASRQHLNATQLAAALASMGLGQMPNTWAKLPTLSMPIDLVVGALDKKFVDIAHAMQQHLPTAKLFCIAKAGHNVLLENPAAIANIIHAR